MNRQQWKDALEGVGILAIVTSLIFVGIETRNSTEQAMLTTRALEISAYQDLMTNIEELNILGIQNDEAAVVLAKFWGDSGDTERFREARAFFLLIRHSDMAFYLYQQGAIGEDRLQSALAPVPFGRPLFREYWMANNSYFADDFREFINDRIAAQEPQ